MEIGANIGAYDLMLSICDDYYSSGVVQFLRPRIHLSNMMSYYRSNEPFPKHSFLFKVISRNEVIYVFENIFDFLERPTHSLLLSILPSKPGSRHDKEFFESAGLLITMSTMMDSFRCMTTLVPKAGISLDTALLRTMQFFE